MLGVTVLLCLSASIVWSETMDDLVKRDGLYYKKFSDVPFSGKIDGNEQGNIKNGKKIGSWIEYYDNGQLQIEENFKNVKRNGKIRVFYRNGKLAGEGVYKNDQKNGLFKYYGEDGELTKIQTFRMNKLVSSK